MSTVGDRLYELGGIPVGKHPPITGNVYFVDSTNGKAGYSGKKPTKALDTIAHALDKCTANNGDVIYVMEGHAENIATTTTVDIDVAGVSIIGLGHGEKRPILTQTATGAYVDAAAANVTIENILFKAGVNTGTVAMLQIQADDCTVYNCEFRNISNALHTNHFIETSATSNAADRLTVQGCKFFACTDDADCDSAISLPGVQDAALIKDNIIIGSFDDAGIHNVTGKVCTNLVIEGNIVEQRQAGDHAIELVSACTGMCVNNRLYATTTAALLDPGALKCIGNKGNIGVDCADFDVPNQGAKDIRLAVHTTAAMSSGFATTDTPDAFTVVGTVLMRCFGVVTTNLTSTSNTGTISLGSTDSAAALIPAATADGTSLQAGDIFFDATSGTDAGALPDDGSWVAVDDSTIQFTIATNNMTAGAMIIYAQWIPISANGNVVAL